MGNFKTNWTTTIFSTTTLLNEVGAQFITCRALTFEVTDTNLATDLCLQNSSHSIWQLQSFGTNLPRNFHHSFQKTKSASPCIVGNFSTITVQRGNRAECSRHLVRKIVQVSTPFTTTWKHRHLSCVRVNRRRNTLEWLQIRFPIPKL
jgi:hypothetical protein